MNYDTAIKLKPDYHPAFYNRGNAYRKKGLYDRAIEDYDTAIVLKPDYHLAFNNRGIAYRRKGLYDRAIEDYNTAIKLKPDYHLAFNNRGNAYRSKGLYDRAFEDYDTAIKLKPDYALAFSNRGNANFYLGRFPAAVGDYERSLSIEPKKIFRVIRLYLARERSGQDARVDLARDASNFDLTDWPGPVVSMFLGRAAPEQVLAAAKHSDQRKQREQNCEAYFYVGQHHLLRGNKRDAAKFFRKVLDTGITYFIEYTGAKAELDRLKLVAHARN